MQPQALTCCENLITLLGEEAAIYAGLAGTLELESTALLKSEVVRIGELGSKKETLALRLKALDESRKLIAKRFATLLGVPANLITVSRLAKAAGGLDGQRLANAAARLKALVL